MAVIDFAKVQSDKAFLTKALQRRGLPVDIGEAITFLARTIRDHKHFERVLTDVEPEDRHDFYEAVAPKLRFQAKPLDMYIASAKHTAEREQLPTLGPDGKLHPFKPAQDVSTLEKQAQAMLDAAVAERNLTLTCVRCTAQETFHGLPGETKVDVIIKARKAGWVYDPAHETETCPVCAKARMN